MKDIVLTWRVLAAKFESWDKAATRQSIGVKWDSEGLWVFWYAFSTTVTSMNDTGSLEFLRGLSAHFIRLAKQPFWRAYLEVPFQGFHIPNARINLEWVTLPDSLYLLYNPLRRQKRPLMELECPVSKSVVVIVSILFHEITPILTFPCSSRFEQWSLYPTGE